MTTSATRRPKIRYSGLHLSLHKYRVMQGEKIIGQFSNQALASRTAREYRAVVLDISVKPHQVVYKDGQWTRGTSEK